MFRMEVDSSPESASVSHYDLIVQRLSELGFPEESLSEGPRGLVAFAKNNKSQLRDLVYAILPTEDEVVDDVIFRVSMVWLQWLMFEDEPEEALEYLCKVSADQRGVCGAVWGNNDIAYRCRTCEHDPTCAICIPCFENGKHEGHDYSIIYTGGGCCDCGDITAWKREGFCSNHKGAEQIQPLPESVAMSMGPVMDLLLSYWKDKLICAKSVSEGSPIVDGHVSEHQRAADELTSSVVDMLLDFCKYSESLLSFISGRVYSSFGLLEILLRSERFLSDTVVAKLHELLLKLLGEPIFKYEFAKAFIVYYASIVRLATSEGNDTEFKKYPLISIFSVQILTVPTLTLRLVEEVDLLGVLIQSLGSIFSSCSGDDGRLQVAKWAILYETTIRVVEDVKFVMGHSSVPKYLCQDRRELVRTLMGLMASLQGMNAQKRETGSHIEDENEYVHFPFTLCHTMSNIFSLLVAGAFSLSSNQDVNEETSSSLYKIECEDQDSLRHAKVGRLSQESTISSITGKNLLNRETRSYADFIPSSAVWLTHESLRSMENWLEIDNTIGPLSASHPRASNSPGLDHSHFTVQEGSCDENLLEGESNSDLEGLRVLSESEWPDIGYDVSSQFISVHIPLHRVLSMVLLRALKECHEYGSSHLPRSSFSADTSVGILRDFLGQILEGCHPNGFSAYVMEHPLRIRVFCAEVHAGMWRRNGDAPILFSEWYRSVRWFEQSQDLDIFLLQCCAALAPPDLYVLRILERFGLSNYLSLNFEQHSEPEPTLVAEMLTLLVQIVKERRFCGMTSAECLHRELVYKLSIGDCTRSQLVKSLPRDLSKMKQLQEVLDTVAEYSQPSGMTQGMYKLRSSYWKELDLYHPRWNSRDQQAAEERYLRFCNVSALTTQLPRWSKVYYPLRGIAKIATCKALLQIIRAVLFYAAFSDQHTPSRAPDDVLLTALHLLALALDVCQVHKKSGDASCYVGDVIPLLAFATEEICTSKYGDQSMLSLLVLLVKMHEKESTENFVEAGNFSLSSLIVKLIKTLMELEPGFLTKLQKLAPELADQFSHSILIGNAKDTESVSESEKRKAKSRERQAAVLEKMRAQQSKFLESFYSKDDEEMDDAKSEEELFDSESISNFTETPEVVCSLCHDAKSKNPLAYLALLQKSRLLTIVGREPPTWEEAGSFGKEHDFFSTTRKDKAPISNSGDSKIAISSQPVESILSAVNDFARFGQAKEVNALIEFVKTQFPDVKNVNLPSLPEDAKESTTLSPETWEEDMYLLIRGSSPDSNNLDLDKNDERFSAAGRIAGNSTSESFLLGKYIAMLPKETLDHPLDHPSASEVSGMQSRNSIVHQGYVDFGPFGGDGIYVSSCGHAVHQGCLDRYLKSLKERNHRRINFEGGQFADPDQGEFLCPVCRGLANSVLPALPGDSRKVPRSLSCSADASSPMHLPEAEFSRHVQDGLSLLRRAADIVGSTETLNVISTRNVKQPNVDLTIRLLRRMYYPGQDTLKTGRVSDSLILWDTLKYSLISTEIAARSRKSSMSPNYSLAAMYKEVDSSSGFILSVLLNVTQSIRTTNPASVLLRLRGLQLFARSLCHNISQDTSSDNPAGNMLYILENADEVQYPDSRLWRRASGPVLAYDAFSSLMWVVFCLPRPVLSCKESLLALVNVFYLVTVIQAISALCKRRNKPDLVVRDSLITDIYQVMRERGEAVQCFDSESVDLAYDFNDSIRILTFPYLRRCALLWKLINCSNSMPFGEISGHGLESSLSTTEELPEIEKLEKMFSIPSLPVIFNDEQSRTTAMRWLSHLPEASENNKQCILRCVPAVPFKLIRLPRLYQDLLQRYIKKSCPKCGSPKDEPALCLLCGELCSPSWKKCCRESCCESHAEDCGAGICVFLMIRRTTILLQRSARQAPWPSPYLDSFGEEDNEMHRGKPLFLSEERYAALTHMVASHGLDRSSKVLRQTTIGALFVF